MGWNPLSGALYSRVFRRRNFTHPMPIYAYLCDACGHEHDTLQKLSDPVLTVCPACHAERYRRKLTAAGFQLKGTGWYVTDFRDSGGKKPTAGTDKGGTENAGPKDGVSKDSGSGESAGAAAAGPSAGSESSGSKSATGPTGGGGGSGSSGASTAAAGSVGAATGGTAASSTSATGGSKA